MRNSTMEYKVNQAYEELNRLIQWHSVVLCQDLVQVKMRNFSPF